MKDTENKSLNILLAEDEDIYQEIIRRYTNALGLQLTIVDNGKKCIEETREGAYDIILMDIEMPEKNGFETTQELRKRGINTPIIAVTSNTWKEDEVNSINSGMDDFLAKPFNKSRLEKMINYWKQRSTSSV